MKNSLDPEDKRDLDLHCGQKTIYTEFYLSAHVLLNLLNKLRKRDEM